MQPTDLSERVGRLQRIGTEMDAIVRDIGPKMIRLAHLRNEVRQIREELLAQQGS